MKNINKLLLSFSSIALFLSCSPTSFQASVDSPLAKSTNLDGGGPQVNPGLQINPDNTFGPGSGTANLTPQEVQSLCPVLNSVDQPGAASVATAPNSIADLVLTGAGNSSHILGSIMNLTIDSFAGEIVAQAQTLVELSSFAGRARISARQSGPITNFAGTICLSTNSVGNISNGAGVLNIIGPQSGMGQGGDITSRAGETYISGLKLGKISNMAGHLTVVGGSVQLITAGAGQVILDNVQVDTIEGDKFAGQIILQNGSTVLHANGGNLIFK